MSTPQTQLRTTSAFPQMAPNLAPENFEDHDAEHLAAAFETALEIEGRAIWLATRLDNGEASEREVRNKLAELAHQMTRHGDDFPTHLRNEVSRLLSAARTAAMAEEHGLVSRSAHRIRAAVESYRTETFA